MITRTKKKSVGSLADISCFSLYPGKNLGAYGDAGIVTTNSKKFYKIIKNLRNLGLGGNELGSEALSMLMPYLAELRNLKELSLGKNNIDLKGVASWASYLSQIQTLKVLTLRSNPIDDATKKILGRCIPNTLVL